MRHSRTLSAAILGLGLTAMTPTIAKADRLREDVYDRREVRIEPRREVRVERDYYADRARLGGERVRVEVVPAYAPPVYYVEPNIDVSVSLRDVPRCAIDTVRSECAGPIEGVQFVRRDGREFYRFNVAGRGGLLNVRVGTNGRLLSIQPC